MAEGDRAGTIGLIGVAGLIGIAAGTIMFLLTAFLGPSVMQPALPGTPGQPPYSLVTHPHPNLVVALVAGGVLVGALGLGLCLHAVRRGWSVSVRGLLLAGGLATVAFTLLPPVGSSDHLNYAAYGRMVITGHDPYATGPADVAGDPVIGAVQEWTGTPSIYGPLATAQQALAAWIGGESVRLTVFGMSVANAGAFLVAGWLLHWAARGDGDRQLRAALLWTVNPLLLFELVSGAHNDTLAIVFAVAALVLLGGPRGSSPAPASAPVVAAGRVFASGALLGVGAAVKVTAGIVGGGLAWVIAGPAIASVPARRDGARPPSRRRPISLLTALVGGVLVVVGPAFALAGPHVLDQIQNASKYVSLATPWHLVAEPLDASLGRATSRSIVQVSSLVLLLALLWLLLRALPRRTDTAGRRQADRNDEWPVERPVELPVDAARVATALVLAWLFAAPYALPWYDGLGWAVLALLPWSGFDVLLLARTALLALAYLPARTPEIMPADLGWLVTGLRSVVIPWALTATLLALVVLSLRRARRAPRPVPPPRARVESPG